jgi:hypothetical protein
MIAENSVIRQEIDEEKPYSTKKYPTRLHHKLPRR